MIKICKLVMFCLMVACLYCGSVSAQGKVHVVTAFDAEAMTAATPETSPTLTLFDYAANGYFSIQVYLNDADGSVTLEWEVSLDGTNWTEPLDADGNRVPDILTSFAFNGGKGSDGREYTPIPKAIMAKYARIKATPGAQNLTALTVLIGISSE